MTGARWVLMPVASDGPFNRLMGLEWVRSSAGEHSLHTGGVTGSIPVAPTIEISKSKHLRERPNWAVRQGTAYKGRTRHRGSWKIRGICFHGVHGCGRRQMTTGAPRQCPWCGIVFTPHQRRGPEKTFCSTTHQREFWSALRQWARQQLLDGNISISELRKLSPNGQLIACTHSTSSLTQISDAPRTSCPAKSKRLGGAPDER